MSKLALFFDFTTVQLKFVFGLSAMALIFAVILLIRTLATPVGDLEPLPVFLGDGDQQYTGVFVLDPNTAPADSLELLPGIGRVLADRIVEYRQHNRFEREVDLTEVSGIGSKKFERLRPYLQINRR